jgi:hypothetical protein
MRHISGYGTALQANVRYWGVGDMRRMAHVIKNRFDGDTCIIPHHYKVSRRDIRIERWNFT